MHTAHVQQPKCICNSARMHRTVDQGCQ
ncbi:TPA: hypothetical protein N0F65_010458 [Lagenidium giganteum]|uniref:Uncharacterized protein n=1 Tax=Lagenidium giganteum TaxID=4803 RepID=A0AAV2YI28_9STRA|nr:TPA: hypothetical protein N0F65_010458 [Lagenidium giganteum]